MPDTPQPTNEELLAFLEKLADFHDTLTPAEQSMLGDLTVGALTREDAEVSGFMVGGPVLNTHMFQGLGPRSYYTFVGDMLGGMGSG